MATSLAEQLKRLQAPQTSLLLQKKSRPSLLFDPKEAANLDRETVFEIGKNGLDELMKLSTAFEEFQNHLFAQSAINLERSVADKALNKKLDARIEKFLILVSPYFLLSPAHKTLEWLIHRFHIHEFNRDQFLLLILPYHETRMFVRALQLVNVSEASDKWHWLKPLQKPGVPLSTTTLVNRVSSDNGFLKLLCEHVCRATKTYDAQASSLGTLYAFFTMSVIGALENSKSITENQMVSILPMLEVGLASSIPDFAASSYMLVGKIASKTKLNNLTLVYIINSMLQDPPLQQEAVLLLVFLFNAQGDRVELIPIKTIKKLARLVWFPEILAKAKASGANTLNFVVRLLASCIKCIQDDDTNATQKIQNMVEQLLTQIRFGNEEIDAILKNTLKLHVPINDISEASTKFLVNFFHSIERQYPEKFDAYLKQLVKQGESDEESQKVLGLLLSWHADINSARGTMQVLDRLHHVDPNQRISGLTLVASDGVQVSNNYKDTVKDAVLARFRDDDENVVLTLLTKFSIKKLRNLFTHDVLVDELLRLVLNNNPYSPKIYGIPALRILLSICSRNDTRVFITVLPYLFPRNDEEVKISMEVLNSDYAKDNSYMQTVRKDAGEEPSGPEAISSAAFHSILDTKLLPSTASILSTLKGREIYGNAANMFFSMILLGSVCRVPVGLLPHPMAKDIIEIASKIVKEYPNVKLLPNCNQLNGDKIVDALELASKGILPLQVGTYVLEMVHRRLDLSANPTLDFEGAGDRSELVMNFLEIFFQGINNVQWSKHYLWCLKIFLKRHFANSEDTICFLSQLFTRPVSAQTSLHCLQITSSLLDSRNSMHWAFTDCTFVPNLLIALASDNSDCRNSAVKILEKLSHTFNLSTQGFSTLLHKLAERKVEIRMDHEQLSLILYTLLSPDPDVQDQITPKLRANLQEGLALLLTTVTKENTPIHTVSQILDILSYVNGLTVLERLAPLGIGLLEQISKQNAASKFAGNALRNVLQRFDVSTVKALTNSRVWELFEKSMKDYNSLILVNNGFIPPSVILMKQINESFFEQVGKLSKIHQSKILASLIDAVTDCEISSVVAAGNKAVRKIRLNAELIINELSQMRDAKAPVPQGERQKSKQRTEVTLNPGIVNSREWKRGITLLEFVQRATNTVEKEELLLPVLFELLSLSLKFEEQSAFEYTKQLLLSSILHLTKNSVAIQQAHHHVDLIAQCIRTSQNPQTHHHALLVLVELFKVADLQSALHNIMPIFTFMGTSVLRQDDAYSIQIISKTIETIMPIINAANDEIHACKVLRVFITSLPDIPEHRRGPLFIKLLQLLENHLHLFFLLTFERHVLLRKKLGVNKDNPEKFDFALTISQEFTPRKLIDVSIQLVKFVRALPVEVDESPRKRFIQFSGNHIFDLNNNSANQLRHFKYAVVQFLTALLGSSEFVNKVAELDSEESSAMKNRYYQLIVEVVMLVQVVSKMVDSNHGQAMGKYWRVMLHYLYDILDNVNSLLPDDVFIESVTKLIEHESSAVRRKALDLLINRLQQKKVVAEEDRTDFLALIEPLMKIVGGKKKAQNQEEEVIQQTVLISLKLLAKVLAAEDPKIFRPILDLTTELIQSRDGPVLASAVLCLAELCGTMKTHAIHSLNKFMPAILKVLRTKCHQENPDVVVISVVTALQKIVDSIGNFLSLYLDQLLFELVRLKSRYSGFDDAKITPIVQRLKTTMQKLSTSVPLRVLLPTVTKTYDTLVSKEFYACVDPLMNVLADSFANAQSQDLSAGIQDLAGFFLKVLQFREDLGIEDTLDDKVLGDIKIIEESASRALVTLVLKLSEATFRPLFYRLYEWAARNPKQKLRNITFYRLSANIANSLKSLFILFAGHFLKHAAALLKSNNASLMEAILEADGEDAADTEDQDLTLPLEINKIELVEAILLTLYRVFIYDPHNFINEERFQTLAQPIIDQLENLMGGKEAYEKRSKELIVPCIASFAGAIQDDSLHKQLVYQTLLKTRHVKSYVRSSALNALVEIARKLGEDFMPLLPETVPFLAELLEDEDEETEKLAQNAVRTLEEVLNEPLQKYF